MRNHALSLKRRQYQKNIITLVNIEQAIVRVQELIDDIFSDSRAIVLFWLEKEGAFVPVKEENRSEKLKFRIFDEFMLWLGEQDRIFSRNDFENNRRFKHISKYAGEFIKKTGAEIIVPFNLNNSVLALLYLVERDAKPYQIHELRFLLEIRDITTVSLSNAALYERLHAMLYNLEEKVKERTGELQSAQAQLIQQEKMASLGVMVAGIAHEINTPTSVVSGSIDNVIKNLHFIFQRISSGQISPVYLRSFIEYSEKISGIKNLSPLSAIEKFRMAKTVSEEIGKIGNLSAGTASSRADFLLDFRLEEDQTVKKMIANLSEDDFQTFQKILTIEKNFSNIRFALSAILNIVKALKHYSHSDQAAVDNIDVSEGIENTLTVFHNQIKHGILVLRRYETVPRITCNPGELNQIWSNLIVNSIHAMKGKGELSISIEEIAFSKVFDSNTIYHESRLRENSSEKSDKKYVAITLQDNGPGIPAAAQSKIFDPFFTTKGPGEGTGLGLGIIRNVVLKHQGLIAFCSEPGKTRFMICLPVLKSA